MKFSKKVVGVSIATIMLGTVGAAHIAYSQDVVTAAPRIEPIIEPTAISVVFPDAELAKAITASLKKASPDELITQDDLNTITAILHDGGSGPKIQSLAGLEYVTNLTTLSAEYHAIVDLQPLAGLTKLTTLNLESNNITDITPLAGLTKLTELNLSVNAIDNMSALKNAVNLTSLKIQYNKLQEVNALFGLTKLTTLAMSGNEITNLAPIRNLTNLTTLFAEHNNIADLKALENLQKITTLNLDRNAITDITVIGQLVNLRDLSLGRNVANAQENPITDYSPLSALSQLESLELQGQGIERIPNDVLTSITKLNVRYTQLTDLRPFLELTNLTHLQLEGNNFMDITPFASADMPLLQELDLTGNFITDVSPFKTAHLPSIRKINLNDQLNADRPEIPYTDSIVVENIVKDVDGNLIAPNRIDPTGKGKYVEPNIEWNLPTPNKKVWINYRWNQKVTIAGLSVRFNGTYVFGVFEQYPVTFMVDDVLHSTFDVTPDSLLNVPENEPTKQGYTFAGWYSAPTGGKKWNFETDKTPRKALTLYARFVGVKYNLTFDNEGAQETLQVTFGEKFKEQVVPGKVGYTFAGWYTAATGGEKWDFATGTMPDHDMVLYAQYTQNVYNVTFERDAVVSEVRPVNFGEFIVEPEPVGKEGYTFIGWYTDSVGGRAWDFASDPMPARDMTLYARYEANVYTVSYKNVVGEEPASEAVAFGSRITPPSDPERASYRFLGWYTDAHEGTLWNFDNDMMPAYDLELFAHWEFVNGKLVARAQNITITRTELLEKAARAELEEEILRRSNVQVVDEDGTPIYDITNATFIVSNLDYLIQNPDAEEYNVTLAYVSATLNLTAPLSTEVKMKVLDEAPVTPPTTDPGTGTKPDSGNKLPQTGLYTMEQIVFSLVLMMASSVLFIISKLRKKRDDIVKDLED